MMSMSIRSAHWRQQAARCLQARCTVSRLAPAAPSQAIHFRQWASQALKAASLAGAADLTCQWLRAQQHEQASSNASFSCLAWNADWQRSSSYASFGVCYVSCVQRLVYRRFDAWFGLGCATSVVAKKVAADMIYGSFIYVPCFYLWTGLWQGRSLSACVQNLRSCFLETIQVYIVLWSGPMFGIFRFVPEAQRVACLAACGFVEKMIYSWIDYAHYHRIAEAAKQAATSSARPLAELCDQTLGMATVAVAGGSTC